MTTRAAAAQPDIPRWLLLAVLFAATALLMATHTGARSPYTYVVPMFGLPALDQYGMMVNPDARLVLPVTQFFYEPRSIDYRLAYNLKLPMQSFLSSIGMAYTHSYLAGTLIVNFLVVCLIIVAAVRLAAQAGLSRGATLVAGLTFFSLPLWMHYIGQPMQYTVSIALHFLILLTAVALVRQEAVTAVNFGILTALITLNYYWYVFAAALFLYLVLTRTLRTARQWALYLVLAAAPLLLWRGFLHLLTAGTISTEIEDSFIKPVWEAWARVITDLRVQPLTPFVASSIGLRIGITQVMALIYWPLIVACAVALFHYRGGERRAGWLAGLLVVAFAVEQMFTAAYEWENNPRRAIPVVFAFGLAYAVAVHRTMASRAWRVLWLLLLVMTVVFAYADRVILAPAITYFDTGEATRGLPKDALAANDRILARNEIPLLPEEHGIQWTAPGRAMVRDSSRIGMFAAAQIGVLAMVCAILAMASAAALLPRWSAAAFAAVWAVSLLTRWL